MRNFCTDIQETAKMRGLTRGGECRSNRPSYTTTTETIHISFTYYDEEPEVVEETGLKKIFSEVKPKEIENDNLDIINRIIKQFIS